MYRGTSTHCLKYVGKEDEADTPPTMCRSAGEPIPNYRSSLTVGPRGCPLLMDQFLIEDIQHFNRGRIPERLFHARGSSAHGYFEVTKDITKYCAAKLFSEVGKRTPVFTRFSLASGNLGTAETLTRGLRGMAMKFYTEDGNWDLTTNNALVFIINEPTLANAVQHSVAPDPASNLLDPNRLWDFMSLTPESTFFQLWLCSDFSLPYSYRFMDAFTGNTYKFINRHGEPIFVRFKMESQQGFRSLTPQRAAQLAGTNPDFSTQDLVEAIDNGEYPSWTMQIQLMTYEQAREVPFNPFNVTKVWPEDQFPQMEVGKLTLNRNTTNHFDESEQVAFNPGNFVPGIRAAEGDKNLQARMFVYHDTQLYRMGVNHNQVPINSPLNAPARNYQREGRGVYSSQGAAPIYFPNSFGGPVESERAAALEPNFKLCGDIVRNDNSDEDHFKQPRFFWNSLLPDHQRRLVTTMGTILRGLLPRISTRILGLIEQVDMDLAQRVRDVMNQPGDVTADETFEMLE